MVELISFFFLGFVIVWVYSLVVDWEISKKKMMNRALRLIGSSVLIMAVTLVLSNLFCHF